MKAGLQLALTLGCAALSATNSRAQWTVVNLHNPAYTQSQGLGIQGGQQVGLTNGVGACLWTGTPGSMVPLNGADAYHASHGRQVGHFNDGTSGNAMHACLWSGTPESRVDLHPAAALQSRAFGNDEFSQVGYVTLGNQSPRAALWYGTPESWVDLAPSGIAWCTGNGQQAGFTMDIGMRAALWTGTAASWTSLHPPGSDSSEIYATRNGWQAGVAAFDGIPHASLWNSTLESWVDLHPSGTNSSRAFGVDCGFQVGVAQYASGEHAVLWRGTASSVVDLHAFLPPEFVRSRARDIWCDGDVLHVIGYGLVAPSLQNRSLMWVFRPPPSCDGDVNCDFALDGFDVETMEKAVGGDVTDYCQPNPDFNGDFALDGFDVEAVELVVGGGPCP